MVMPVKFKGILELQIVSEMLRVNTGQQQIICLIQPKEANNLFVS